MTKTVRASYTLEFKHEAVRLVTGGQSIAAAFSRDPGLLDFDLRADYEAADDDGAALRVIVDQVASLTDTRALELAKSWDLIP